MKAKAKNLVAIFAAALALLMSVVLFAACGDSDPVGTYKFSSMTAGGETYKVGDEIPELGQKFDENYLTIELKEDKTFTMSMMGIPEEGTWELDGKTLTLTFTYAAEAPEECTLSGGTITMEDDSGATVKLKK